MYLSFLWMFTSSNTDCVIEAKEVMSYLSGRCIQTLLCRVLLTAPLKGQVESVSLIAECFRTMTAMFDEMTIFGLLFVFRIL